MLAAGDSHMSHHPAQTAGASRRFDLSVEDFRKQAGAGGFWRGLGVGFLSAFFLFDTRSRKVPACRRSSASLRGTARRCSHVPELRSAR
jgi:hypothetical protein